MFDAEKNARPCTLATCTCTTCKGQRTRHPAGCLCDGCYMDLIGGAAIDYAELHGLQLSKYADPIEGHRADLDPDAARKIAMEDPSLIYIQPTT